MFESLSNNGLLIIENALPEIERIKIISYFEELKIILNLVKNGLKSPIIHISLMR